jgi:predicted transcriptional regulator
MSKTTIQISKDLQHRLKLLAAFKNTSYEFLIEELISVYENNIGFKTDKLIKNLKCKVKKK